MAERTSVLPPARTEWRDVRLPHMAAAAAWMALALAIVLLGAWWAFPGSMTDQHVAEPVPAFAAPRLQPSPRADMDRFAAQQRAALEGAYWLDREHGVVHLPIADAMRKVAEEGIPDWPVAKQ